MASTVPPNQFPGQVSNFLAWTFGLTWLIWIPVAAFNPEQEGWLVPVVIAGAFVPSIMGIVYGVLLTSSEHRKDFVRRLMDPRLVGWKFWLFILLMAPLIQGAGAFADWLAGGPAPILDQELFGSASSLVLFLIFVLISGPLAEELGWRGILLPAFLASYTPFKSALLVGVIWVFWHLPLFWIEGTSQEVLGFFTIHGLLWITEVMALSVIVAWVFINTNWSILGAVILHLMDNLAFSTITGSDYERSSIAALTTSALYMIIAAVILYRTELLSETARS